MILMAANPVLSPMTYPISAYVSELHQLLSSHRLMTDRDLFYVLFTIEK